MVSEFKWPASIPSGQRTYKTPSCLIRKTIKSIVFEYSDGISIDLFEDEGFDENLKLFLITGAIGAFCGIKNSLYAGYVAAAFENNKIENTSEFAGSRIKIKWNSEGKKDISCYVNNLNDLVSVLYRTLNYSDLINTFSEN